MAEPMFRDNLSWDNRILKENIREVVFGDIVLKNTREDALTYTGWGTEYAGYVNGFLDEETFYIFSNTILDIGVQGKVSLGGLSKVEGLYQKNIEEIIPELRTVMFHSHPRLLEKDFRKEGLAELLNDIFSGIDMGIYEELKADYPNLTPEDVLNEEFRVLNREDLKGTHGRYHLLLSPTPSVRNLTSHLNFYDVKNSVSKVNIRESYSKNDRKIMKKLHRREIEAREKSREEFLEKVGSEPRSMHSVLLGGYWNHIQDR